MLSNLRTTKSFLSIIFLGLFIACGNNDNSTSTDDDDDTSAACETDGEVDQSTDTEIEAMREAMVNFRASLSSTLLNEADNCLDNERFYLWHNTPNTSGTNRDGIIYDDLTDAQLTAFKEILQLFLSTEGYEKVYEITELAEGWLEDSSNMDAWSPGYYSIDMFGDPETSGSWGFQLDGHHCAINFLVHGDNVSMVPAFMGGEPAEETYNGTDYNIFENEKALAIALYNGMTDTELSSALISTTDRDLRVGAADMSGDPDPYRGTYDYSGFTTGLKYSDMSTDTQANVIALMKEHVYNLTDTFADDWWTDISANLDDTYFVFVYDEAPSTTSQFYYRVYNPYLWAEFNTEDVTGANANTIADYNHVHAITRIPNNPTTDNGGDYGIFAQLINNGGPRTLLEHYALSNHHNLSTIKFDYTVEGLLPERYNHGHSHSHG
ncbi:DUF3500 domain-containing protein [Tamlana sp. 62-3]|uniref:DUF3500 domain-containing protein n=1 Tax=Neotamlana sargassicola TaxID=2883125 RepID=A0A9X1L830_9FLAO|nr:DUF3500 domain-containing protein [Tamlana sargassicola]MCB4809134.1 DUF3500 domain-containing protein [Tamlana sargassicola]